MPQPPVIVLSSSEAHFSFSQYLSRAMQFKFILWDDSQEAVKYNRYKSDCLYFSDVFIQEVDHTRVNVIVFDAHANDDWYSQYLQHYRETSHYRFTVDELMADGLAFHRFLIKFQYVYHGDLVAQEYNNLRETLLNFVGFNNPLIPSYTVISD